MPIMYLYDTTTNKAAGIYDGPAAPPGTADAGVAPSDGRMEWSGSAWVLPDATKWEDIRTNQAALIEEVRWIVERVITQKELGLTEGQRDITDFKYTEYLQYMQDIRDCDEANHATPELAQAALDALIKPTH